MHEWGLKDWLLLFAALVSAGGLFAQLVINLAMRDRDRADFVEFKNESARDRARIRESVERLAREVSKLDGRLEDRDR